MNYPTDRKNCGYSIRYVKWLMQSGVVNEIGPDAFALLVAVVMTEDDIHYQRPPTFYNEQLLSKCGIGSEPAMMRARGRAVAAGLLEYSPGAKRRPGIYFVSGFTNESFANPERIRNESVTNRLPTIPLPLPLPKTHSDEKSSESVLPKSQKRKTKPKTLSGFDQWYEIYPRKVSRGDAEKAFPKAIADIEATDNLDTPQAIAELLRLTRERLQNLLATEAKFRKHPATWLNAKGYRDEIGSKHKDLTPKREKTVYPRPPKLEAS